MSEAVCMNPPRLKSRSIYKLKEEDLACPPTVQPVVMQLQSEPGRNISFRCKVSGVPEAWVSWWQNSRLLANGSELAHSWESQLYKVSEYPEETGGKVSELYIFDIKPQDAGVYYCRGNNAAGWARANFTITVTARDNEEEGKRQDEEEDKQMFQVEYILGVGAGLVIVCTIIIVLILYIMLQCRQRRRDRRLRKLICDSHSGSFAERSTVDYIVPGEMELLTAVRSVSCNSSMAKCKQGEDDEYGVQDNPPIIDTLFVKNKQPDCPPPPPPPSGLSCSNPDLVQEAKLWDRSLQQNQELRGGGQHPSYLPSYANYYAPQSLNYAQQGGSYAPHQYFPPGAFYAQNLHPHIRLQYLTGYPGLAYPHYRGGGGAGHPGGGAPGLPQQQHHQLHQKQDDQGETVLSANGLAVYPGGDGLVWSGPVYYQYTGEQHTKDCPRSRNHSGFNQIPNHTSNTEPYIVEDPDSNQRSGFPPGSVYANHLCGPPPYVPPPKVNQWSLEDDEMKFGPFSDGEAETIKRLPRLSRRGGHPQGRSQHPHYATMSRRLEGRGEHVGRLRGGPRYSSQPQLNQSRERSNSAIQGILSPFSMKTSITLPRRLDSKLSNGYPDLARHPLSYSSVPPTFSTLPVPNPYSSSSPQPYSSTPEPYNPQPYNTTTTNSIQIERTQSLDSEYHPSRSSSVGEIDLGDKGSNPSGSWRIRTNENQWDGELEYQNWNNSQIPELSRINGHGRNQSWDPDSSWPGEKGEEWQDSRIESGRRESSRQDGRCESSTWQDGRMSQSHWVDGDGQDWMEDEDRTGSCRNTLQRSGNFKRPRSGAVKVDLSWADKSIRRPDSAPDLISADESMMNGGGSSLKKSSSTKNRRKSADRTSRARSTSSDRTTRTPCRKPGVSPGGRKQVVFAGLEDNSSTSSEDKNSKESLNSENEVWVKRSDKSGLDDDDDDIPVTGVVIAKPSACQFYQNAHK